MFRNKMKTLLPEPGRLSTLTVKGGILMRRNSKALLSSILLIVFVLSMVATVYTTSDAAGHPRLYVCCTKVLANGTVIEGLKQYGMPDATCSYDLCVEVGEFCNCSITK